MDNSLITIYRVRKSPKDIASQKGAFFIFAAAVQCAMKTKRNIYNNSLDLVWSYEDYLKNERKS